MPRTEMLINQRGVFLSVWNFNLSTMNAPQIPLMRLFENA